MRRSGLLQAGFFGALDIHPFQDGNGHLSRTWKSV
jgi:fido (protein-threonine AMPylation protein)